MPWRRHFNKESVSNIGQDMWRQLKRVQIPPFTGDKRHYLSWRAAFLACIDSAPATGEYKLLQLRQYLSGEALKVIRQSVTFCCSIRSFKRLFKEKVRWPMQAKLRRTLRSWNSSDRSDRVMQELYKNDRRTDGRWTDGQWTTDGRRILYTICPHISPRLSLS